MTTARTDRPVGPSRNMISGYPTGVSYRYVAETFGDKLREQKLREKQMFFSLLDSEFFKIKRKPREVLVAIDTPFYRGVCDLCNSDAKRKKENYFVNILESQQLSLLKWAKQQFCVYPRLFCIRTKRSVDCGYSVLKNEEFREFLDDFLLQCDTEGFKHKRQTVTREKLQSWTTKAAKNMTYSFSSIVFKCVAIGWHLISSKFLSKLIVSPVEVNSLIERHRTEDLPFVYILQSRGKFDWFKVLFVLVFCQLKAPVIILSREERSWLRWIYRRCGVTFHCSPNGEKPLKNAVLDEFFTIFVDENLKKKNDLMFYFDSAAESDNEILFGIIVDSVRRKSVEDVVIVPTSVCHEKVECADLVESYKFSLKELFQRTNRTREFVKLTFCQPYSLKEMMQAVGTSDECKSYDPAVTKYGDGLSRGLATKIYSHIAYDFCQVRALTSTNVVSYLLLMKFRNGVKLDDLVSELDEFRARLKSLEKPVAFTGSSTNVVNRALKLFSPGTVTVDRKQDGLIVPALEPPYISELTNYANPTSQFFMLDALIMRTIYTLRKEPLEEALKNNWGSKISFFYEEFIRTALELADILQFESPFFKPCRPRDSQIEDFLFKFVCNNYIIKVEELMTAEEEWSRRVAKNLEGFDEDDEDDEYNEFDPEFDDDYSYDGPAPVSTVKGEEYQINYRDDPLVLKNIFFFKNSLNAIIRAYLISAENLTKLIGQQVIDSTYFRMLKSKMMRMLASNDLEFAESISLDTLKNSMKLFIAWGVVQSHSIDGIQVFYLSDNYNSEEKLRVIVEKIRKFR